jgi:hypothetical protein
LDGQFRDFECPGEDEGSDTFVVDVDRELADDALASLPRRIVEWVGGAAEGGWQMVDG